MMQINNKVNYIIYLILSINYIFEINSTVLSSRLDIFFISKEGFDPLGTAIKCFIIPIMKSISPGKRKLMQVILQMLKKDY